MRLTKMDKEIILAIICFGLSFPFVGGIIGYYFGGLTSYWLFLYVVLHPIVFISIAFVAVYFAEKEIKQLDKQLKGVR